MVLSALFPAPSFFPHSSPTPWPVADGLEPLPKHHPKQCVTGGRLQRPLRAGFDPAQARSCPVSGSTASRAAPVRSTAATLASYLIATSAHATEPWRGREPPTTLCVTRGAAPLVPKSPLVFAMSMPALALSGPRDVDHFGRLVIPSSPITPAMPTLPLPAGMAPRRASGGAESLASFFSDSCRVAPPSEPLPSPRRRSRVLPPSSPFVLEDTPAPPPPADDLVTLSLGDDVDEIQVCKPTPRPESGTMDYPSTVTRCSSSSSSSLNFSTCSSASFAESNPSAPPTPTRRPRTSVHAILIAGAPLSVSEPALVDLFASLGPVVYSRTLPLADGTRLARLLYVSPSAVAKAVRLDGARLGGRLLTVVHAGKEGMQLRQLAAALNDQLSGASASAAGGIVARAMAAWTSSARPAVGADEVVGETRPPSPTGRSKARRSAEDARALALNLAEAAAREDGAIPVTAAVREARARLTVAAAEEARGERVDGTASTLMSDADGWSWGAAVSAATRAAAWVSSPWPSLEEDSPC